MRRRAIVASAVAAAGVLTTAWIIGSQSETTATSTSASSGSATLADGTFTGTAEETRYGPVQVEITVSGGKITAITSLELTDADPRSEQISNAAAPILRSEALAAQSANVATVSGATYTTEGYLSSLQSAIDKAKS